MLEFLPTASASSRSTGLCRFPSHGSGASPTPALGPRAAGSAQPSHLPSASGLLCTAGVGAGAILGCRNRLRRSKLTRRADTGKTTVVDQQGGERKPLEELVQPVRDTLLQLDALTTLSMGRPIAQTTEPALKALLKLEKLAQGASLSKAAGAIKEVLELGEVDSELSETAAIASVAALHASSVKSLLPRPELCLDALEIAEEELSHPPLAESKEGLVQQLDECFRAVRREEGFGRRVPAPDWPPPPPPSDEREEARAARLPVLAAFAEACRDADAGLGTAELILNSHSEEEGPSREVALQSLLDSFEGAALLGNQEVTVTGLVDALPFQKPGDLLVLTLEEEASASELQELLQGVSQEGTVAVAFCENNVGKMRKRLEGLDLGELAVLLLPTDDELPSAAATIARALFSGAAAEKVVKPKLLVGVVGGKAAEVGIAATLLSAFFEQKYGAASSGLLSSGRSLLGYKSVDINHPLTPCSVQELLSEMVSLDVEACIVEIAPGSHADGAFDLVDFDFILDLGCQEDHLAWREGALRWSKQGGLACGTAADVTDSHAWRFELTLPDVMTMKPKGATTSDLNVMLGEQVTHTVKKGLHAASYKAYVFTTESPAASKKASSKGRSVPRSKAGVLEELAKLGIDAPSKAKYAELRATLAEALLDGVKPVPVEKPQEPVEVAVEEVADNFDKMVRGRVLRGTLMASLKLEVAVPGAGSVQMALPLIGPSSARAATAAACAALALEAQGKNEMKESMRKIVNAFQAAPRPPGILELFKAPPAAQPKVLGLLHEAKSPAEVRDALQEVKSWMHLKGPKDTSPVETAPKLIAVFGCEGEESRGDRAKYGWALAEFCDEVVLTSNNPRTELPMQIMEDVLDAMRALAETSTAVPLDTIDVISDRADAIKLALCHGLSREFTDNSSPPGVVIVFGSKHIDFQEVADESGEVQKWLFSDRRVLLESLQMAESLGQTMVTTKEIDSVTYEVPMYLNPTKVPWSLDRSDPAADRIVMLLPGKSLHWSFNVGVSTAGKCKRLL